MRDRKALPSLVLLAVVLLTSATGSNASTEAAAETPRRVAILVYDGVVLLDFAGPAQVLEVAGRFAARDGEPAFELFTVAAEGGPVVSQGFLTLEPEHTIDTAPAPDLLVVPGGGVGAVLRDDRLMAWIDETIGRTLTLTVCNGATIAAELGRLDGREATSFYGALPSMQQRYPEVSFQPGRRFVDSGSIVTTAGVSAGIDGALHLVARLLGRHVAEDTARHMEYRWTPEPYLVASYSHLDPSLGAEGRRRQQAEVWRREGADEMAEEAYRELLGSTPGDAGLWYDLGKVLLSRKDHEGAIDAFREAARDPDRRAFARYNAACAAALDGRPELALEMLEGSVEAGFRSFRYMDRDSDLEPLREDPGYRGRYEELLERARKAAEGG